MASTLKSFRLVIRGTDHTGRRVRRVHHTWCASFKAAQTELDTIFPKLGRKLGLANVHAIVLPPLAH